MSEQKAITQYLLDFLDYSEIEKGLSSKTQENYTRFLRKFFNWLNSVGLASLKPAALSAEHIWQYKVFLSRHVDPKTKKPTRIGYKEVKGKKVRVTKASDTVL